MTELIVFHCDMNCPYHIKIKSEALSLVLIRRTRSFIFFVYAKMNMVGSMELIMADAPSRSPHSSSNCLYFTASCSTVHPFKLQTVNHKSNVIYSQ